MKLSEPSITLLHLVKRRKYITLEELQKFKIRYGEKNLISSLIMKGLLKKQEENVFILTDKALHLLEEMENEEVKNV